MSNIKTMRKLSVRLTATGTAEQISNPQKLYQGSYGFVLMQCYVPVTPNTTEYPLCKVFKTTLDNKGNRINDGKPFAMVYAANVTLDGFEYQVFECPMPREFTEVVGDLTLVYNYYDSDGSGNAKDILVSNAITFPVSAGGINLETIKLNNVDAVTAQVNKNTADIAVNKAGIATNKADIAVNKSNITGLRNTVADLEDRLEVSEADILEIQRTKFLTDITSNPETGQGEKFYSDGSVVSIQYAYTDGELIIATVNAIEFNESSWIIIGDHYEIAFSPAATGRADNNYLVNVRRTGNENFTSGEYLGAENIFLGSDGSMLLSSKERYAGRIVFGTGERGEQGEPGISGDYSQELADEIARATAAEAELSQKINSEVTRATTAENTLASRASTIEGKIPEQASTSNQLADKAFVNSSVEQSAANRVTLNAAGDGFPTRAALLNATTVYHNGQAYTPTKHDYAIVLRDEGAPEPYTGNQSRFEYSETQWEFAYSVNTSFTAAERATLNSGLTAEDKAKLDGIEERAQVNEVTAADLDTKQDKLTAGENITIANNVISASGGGGSGGFDKVYEEDSSSTNAARIVNNVPNVTSMDDLLDKVLWIKAIKSNGTLSMTLNINGLGAHEIIGGSSSLQSPNTILDTFVTTAGVPYSVMWNGTYFVFATRAYYSSSAYTTNSPNTLANSQAVYNCYTTLNNAKQDKLIAGRGISITNNIITVIDDGGDGGSGGSSSSVGQKYYLDIGYDRCHIEIYDESIQVYEDLWNKVIWVKREDHPSYTGNNGESPYLSIDTIGMPIYYGPLLLPPNYVQYGDLPSYYEWVKPGNYYAISFEPYSDPKVIAITPDPFGRSGGGGGGIEIVFFDFRQESLVVEAQYGTRNGERFYGGDVQAGMEDAVYEFYAVDSLIPCVIRHPEFDLPCAWIKIITTSMMQTQILYIHM